MFRLNSLGGALAGLSDRLEALESGALDPESCVST
jgi:hypothetical protein